jgi:hypothetical protein
LGRSFVGADPDGLFGGYQGPRRLDTDRVWQMVEELRAAEPGQRHLITDDYGKVTGALPEPSTFPDWLGTHKSRRTRQHADRIIRLLEMRLNEIPMVTGSGPFPPGFVRISREDMALLHWALDIASKPLDEAALAELLDASEEATPNGSADAPPDWVTEPCLEQPDQDHRREQEQERRPPFERADYREDQQERHNPPARE